MTGRDSSTTDVVHLECNTFPKVSESLSSSKHPKEQRSDPQPCSSSPSVAYETVPSSTSSYIRMLAKETPTLSPEHGILNCSKPHADNANLQHIPYDDRAGRFRYHVKHEGEFICGWGAAFINICVTFPLNKIIFRQQLHDISSLKAYHQLSRDGMRYLYRGLLPPLLQKTTSVSLMFGAYAKCQDKLSMYAPFLPTTMNHAYAAMMAGTLEAMFTPFERVQTLMQAEAFHNKFSNTVDAFWRLRSFGVQEYYRGFSIIVMRNGPSNVCFFLGREHLQSLGPQNLTGGKKLAKDFLCGACLGAVISTFFFPFNVVKAHMQYKLGGKFDGVHETFRLVISQRDGKVRNLFRGMHLNYTRSFISWGIINASYELLMKTFYEEESKFR